MGQKASFSKQPPERKQNIQINNRSKFKIKQKFIIILQKMNKPTYKLMDKMQEQIAQEEKFTRVIHFEIYCFMFVCANV